MAGSRATNTDAVPIGVLAEVRENRPMNWGMSGAGDLAQAQHRYADEQKVHCITCSQDPVFPGRSPPHTY